MKRLCALLAAFGLLAPLWGVEVRLQASDAPEAEQPVMAAVRSLTRDIEGDELAVSISSFTQDEEVTSLIVTLQAGEHTLIERPLVATNGWKKRLKRLLESQLAYDLARLYPPDASLPVLEEYYLVRPKEGFSFRPGQAYKARSDHGTTGLLLVRDVYPEVIRLDALSDHGIQIGQSLVPASGQSLEGWVSVYPLGGELSYTVSWPYPFALSLAVGSLDDRFLFEAGLEKRWPLSSFSRSWFLRNSSIAAAVRAGIAVPFAIGASASITYRIMVTSSLSFAVSGRLLYYGNQEEKREWQNGYQLTCGVGYHW